MRQTDNYDFERLITDGYAYVDKTDMLWKLANGRNGILFFISRPRRFGKSLMLSTFKYMFQRRKDLFRGLKIEKKKWDWSQTYPVIFMMMTGVSKFTKLSVFSALNNLTDLTMDRPEFAGPTGSYTIIRVLLDGKYRHDFVFGDNGALAVVGKFLAVDVADQSARLLHDQ